MDTAKKTVTPWVPRRVVLHVGMTKAGSTSIQNVLDAHRGALLEQGILFPKSVFVRSNPNSSVFTPGHLELLRILKSGKLDVFKAECEAVADQADTLLLSAENIFSDQPDEVLEMLADLLSGCDITIVAVLRSQLAWALSRYSESVMKGHRHEARALETYLADMMGADYLDYSARLDRLAALLGAGKVLAIDYQDAAAHNGLIGEFLKVLDIDIDAGVATLAKRDNASVLMTEGLHAQRHLNLFAEQLVMPSRLSWSYAMREMNTELVHSGEGTKGYPEIPDGVCESWDRHFTTLNQKLNAKYFPDRPYVNTPVSAEAFGVARPQVVDHLTVQGFTKLMEIHEASGVALRKTELPVPALALDAQVLAKLLPLYRTAQVILEYGVHETTVFASFLAQKIIYSMGEYDEDAIRLQTFLFDHKTPSPLVFATCTEADIWSQPWFRHPDLVRLHASDGAEKLGHIAPRIERPVTLLLEDYYLHPLQGDLARFADLEAVAGHIGVLTLRPGCPPQ